MGTPSNRMFLAGAVKNTDLGSQNMGGMALFTILSAAGRSLSAVSTIACKRKLLQHCKDYLQFGKNTDELAN
jgi:hypothetical protein